MGDVSTAKCRWLWQLTVSRVWKKFGWVVPLLTSWVVPQSTPQPFGSVRERAFGGVRFFASRPPEVPMAGSATALGTAPGWVGKRASTSILNPEQRSNVAFRKPLECMGSSGMHAQCSEAALQTSDLLIWKISTWSVTNVPLCGTVGMLPTYCITSKLKIFRPNTFRTHYDRSQPVSCVKGHQTSSSAVADVGFMSDFLRDRQDITPPSIHPRSTLSP